ncbi:MAG TPA: hypothetical protein VFG59_03845 [Anaeromyxobacter sp.]|nr:hypothetical protein [Anaeromyxobacter sp.]
MARITAPIVIAIVALAVPLLALLAMANGAREWDDDDTGESCSLC